MSEPFEANLKRLEAITKTMEDPDLDLDRLLELYDEGMGLTATCEQQLVTAQQRVEALREKKSAAK